MKPSCDLRYCLCGFYHVLPVSARIMHKNILVGEFCYAKTFKLNVNKCVNVFVLCHVMGWQPIQGVFPCLLISKSGSILHLIWLSVSSAGCT